FWALIEASHPQKHDSVMNLAMEKLQFRGEGGSSLVLTGSNQPHEAFRALLPLLAARIDMTFESNRDGTVLLEGLLVASSLRTVYSVPQHRQYLRGGYPSEPFVAEAAARSIYKFCSDNVQDELVLNYKSFIPKAVAN
ncbi:hypothetical protein H0H92_000828, partial [Tricholoma furcatifolium]